MLDEMIECNWSFLCYQLLGSMMRKLYSFVDIFDRIVLRGSTVWLCVDFHVLYGRLSLNKSC